MVGSASQPLPDKQPAAGSLLHRVVFRFLFTYFLLYALPGIGRISIFQSFLFGGVLFGWYIRLWQESVRGWAAMFFI